MTFQTTRFGGSPAIQTSAVLGLQLMILAFQPLLHWSQRGGKLGWYLDILGRTPFKMRLQKSAIENYIHIIFIRVCMYVYIYISSKSAWSAMVSSPQQKCKTWSNVVVYGMVYVWSYPCTSISVREPDTFFIRPPWYLFELSAHGEWVHDLWISKCWLDQS